MVLVALAEVSVAQLSSKYKTVSTRSYRLLDRYLGIAKMDLYRENWEPELMSLSAGKKLPPATFHDHAMDLDNWASRGLDRSFNLPFNNEILSQFREYWEPRPIPPRTGEELLPFPLDGYATNLDNRVPGDLEVSSNLLLDNGIPDQHHENWEPQLMLPSAGEELSLSAPDGDEMDLGNWIPEDLDLSLGLPFDNEIQPEAVANRAPTYPFDEYLTLPLSISSIDATENSHHRDPRDPAWVDLSGIPLELRQSSYLNAHDIYDSSQWNLHKTIVPSHQDPTTNFGFLYGDTSSSFLQFPLDVSSNIQPLGILPPEAQINNDLDLSLAPMVASQTPTVNANTSANALSWGSQSQYWNRMATTETGLTPHP